MQNKQILDSAITASSEYRSASYGRLHFLRRSWQVTGGWVAQWNDKDQFFQVNFIDWRKVTRVAIQGRVDEDQWVESFSLSYGFDSVFFQDYTEEEEKKVFPGNFDRYTPVSHDLKNPIITRYIRINPITWKSHISMRAEFYGCREGLEIPEIVCASPLGMENGKIPDSSIVASSRFDQFRGPERGRLNEKTEGNFKGGWVPYYYPKDYQFLQIDLENVTKVTRIATQGSFDINWWTKTYTLDYSQDGVTFTSHNNGQVLQGNTDKVHTVGHILDPPIIARFIKINVKTYQEMPSLRVELYGCSDGFPTPKPPLCLEALGMQNKQIPDSAITASSEYRSASYGRLHFLRRSWQVTGGWVAQWNDKDQFFQVNFIDWRKVTRVAIQGRVDEDQWVESFSLSYGYDSVLFQDYTEEGVKRVFPGNNDRYTPVSNDLKYPIITPYIRIHPESWHDHISMRTEFYGCIEGEN
ncbi:lactadherin-like [Orbicella faveolata]|uniref:lactadherin-like n=1 Tax=Orbicella faveolata TaxID=48498 RepID=UPI0009E1DCC0|nr:lactadherin-like [Orbicella faveolata]